MLTPPQSTPHPSDPDDISLDESKDREQLRPRLPDQRRENIQFDLSGSAATVRGHEATTPFGGNVEVRAEKVEEIETYDPTRPEPPVEKKRRPEAGEPANEVMPPTAVMDDLEEFISRTANEGPPGEAPAYSRGPLSLMEKVCSSAGALLLLALGFWLIHAVASESDGGPPVSLPRPKLPMEGELVIIKEAAANWRARAATDKVRQMEVILPVPGHQEPEYIPQVTFTVDESKGKSGYLRFIFRNSESEIRGDPVVIQVQSGKLVDMGKGEIITSGSQGSVYCSEGMQSIEALHAYTFDTVPRWSVRVLETADYGAKNEDCKILGTFDVSNDLAK